MHSMDPILETHFLSFAGCQSIFMSCRDEEKLHGQAKRDVREETGQLNEGGESKTTQERKSALVTRRKNSFVSRNAC